LLIPLRSALAAPAAHLGEPVNVDPGWACAAHRVDDDGAEMTGSGGTGLGAVGEAVNQPRLAAVPLLVAARANI
jgi:hypothetical protein